MNAKSYTVTEEYKKPKIGDCHEFLVTILSIDKTLTYTARLTGTEIAGAINKGCIKNEDESLEKLKTYTIYKAKKYFLSNDFEGEKKIFKLFSPCW